MKYNSKTLALKAVIMYCELYEYWILKSVWQGYEVLNKEPWKLLQWQTPENFYIKVC